MSRAGLSIVDDVDGVGPDSIKAAVVEFSHDRFMRTIEDDVRDEWGR